MRKKPYKKFGSRFPHIFKWPGLDNWRNEEKLHQDIEEWCKDNLTMHHIDNSGIYIQNNAEAILYKLTWEEGS